MINALPILFPAISPDNEESKKTPGTDGPTLENPGKTVEVAVNKHRARLSLSAHAQLVFLRKHTRRWHAAIAGAIAGGLAVIWEKKSRREIIAQQLFVRYVCSACFSLMPVGNSTSVACRDLIIRSPLNIISTFPMVMCWCSHWRKFARHRCLKEMLKHTLDAARSCMRSSCAQIPFPRHTGLGRKLLDLR